MPDYSTLSRRQGDLEVELQPSASKQPRHLVMDSTGLNVYGEGQWKQRTHGKSKRRTWRKLHVGVDSQTGEITAVTLTQNSKHGSSQAEAPLAV